MIGKTAGGVSQTVMLHRRERPYIQITMVMLHRSVRPYILTAMGKSERKAVLKHTKVSHVVCHHHVAVDTFPFTSMVYTILA